MSDVSDMNTVWVLEMETYHGAGSQSSPLAVYADEVEAKEKANKLTSWVNEQKGENLPLNVYCRKLPPMDGIQYPMNGSYTLDDPPSFFVFQMPFIQS